MKPYFSVIFGFLFIVLFCWSKPFLKNLIGWDRLFLRAFCIFFSNEHFFFFLHLVYSLWSREDGLHHILYISFWLLVFFESVSYCLSSL